MTALACRSALACQPGPTSRAPKVRFVRVLVLPYWPPGVAYIDNVRLTEYEEK